MKTHDKSSTSPEGRTKWNSAFGKCSGTRWLGAQNNLTVPESRTFGPPGHVKGRRVTAGQGQTLEMDELSLRLATAGNRKKVTPPCTEGGGRSRLGRP